MGHNTHRMHAHTGNSVSMCLIMLNQLVRSDIPDFDRLVGATRHNTRVVAMELNRVHDTAEKKNSADIPQSILDVKIRK